VVDRLDILEGCLIGAASSIFVVYASCPIRTFLLKSGEATEKAKVFPRLKELVEAVMRARFVARTYKVLSGPAPLLSWEQAFLVREGQVYLLRSWTD